MSHREHNSLKLTHCPACGYDLAGLPANHACPECAFEYDERTYRLPNWDYERGYDRPLEIIFAVACVGGAFISAQGNIVLPMVLLCIALVLVGDVWLRSRRPPRGENPNARKILIDGIGVRLLTPVRDRRLFRWSAVRGIRVKGRAGDVWRLRFALEPAKPLGARKWTVDIKCNETVKDEIVNDLRER